MPGICFVDAKLRNSGRPGLFNPEYGYCIIKLTKLVLKTHFFKEPEK